MNDGVYEEFYKEFQAWQKRAVAAYERHDSPSGTSTLLGLLEPDDSEKKAFAEWFKQREDLLLWRFTKQFFAQRARGSNKSRNSEEGIQFVAESWPELRRLIETWDLLHGSQGNLRSKDGPMAPTQGPDPDAPGATRVKADVLESAELGLTDGETSKGS